MTVDVASAAVLILLAERESGATICPSEVARKIVTATSGQEEEDWRRRMPIVHAAVDQLLAKEIIRLSWKGMALSARAGPYRIARAKDNSSGGGQQN